MTIHMNGAFGPMSGKITFKQLLASLGWGGAITEQKLQASDASTNDLYGWAADISQDGNTAIVGAKDEDSIFSNAGQVYVYTRIANAWSEQQKFQANDPSASARFGNSVALSANGSTAVITAQFADVNSTGAAYVFTRSGSVWTQQQKLTLAVPATNDFFGTSCSISDDGDTLVIGAESVDSNAGAAYVFTRSGSVWTQQQKLVSLDLAAGDNLGKSVSISGESNTIVVGTSLEDSGGANVGAAYVFTRSGSVWTQQQKIQAGDGTAGDYFGGAASLSQDGDTLVIGADRDDAAGSFAGSAYVFTRTAGVWTQQQKLVSDDIATNDQFGNSVTISDDGNTVVVGAFAESSQEGSAYVFTRTAGVWTQQQKLVASVPILRNLGKSVAISGDGATTIAGAYSEASGTGSVYFFMI